MEEQNSRITIDYVAHEADMARMERINRRLWIALLIVILLFTASNAFWIWRESQFEDVITTTETVTQDTGNGNGNNTFSGDFVGGDYYGETNSNTNTNKNAP